MEDKDEKIMALWETCLKYKAERDAAREALKQASAKLDSLKAAYAQLALEHVDIVTALMLRYPGYEA